jgi:hypothetical protein
LSRALFAHFVPAAALVGHAKPVPYMPRPDAASREAEWQLLLDSQKRMISTAQALALGETFDKVRWHVKTGQWQRVHQGVYATFSGELSREARLWAVILRVGDHAVLSHETAAEIHRFADRPSDKIHVTVPLQVTPTRWSQLAGVVVHRTANWRADPQPRWNLPRTPVGETVLDLVTSARTLDDAYAWLSRAITQGRATPAMIADALVARKRKVRRAWLEDALTDIADGIHFPLERRWTRDVERAHGLPRPARQARRADGDGFRYLDNHYEEYNLCAELDGMAFHLPEDLARDRYRDNETKIATSAETFRYGFREVANRPCEQAEQFARALIKRGWPAGTLKACSPRCPVALLVARHQGHERVSAGD